MTRRGDHRLGEFGRIARLLRPLATDPGALGLEDDAALLRPGRGEEFVITADAIVAGVHFLGSEAPELIARKLLRVNLSDLAAMGATPRAYMLTLALPSSCDDAWVERFARGLRVDQESFGLSLIGGDSVSTPGPITLSVTMMGSAPIGTAIRRSTAAAGDLIFVSGTIGDAALGLLVAQGRLKPLADAAADFLQDRYDLPQPRCLLGQRLRGIATAMADISDGLVADLGHIAAASHLGFRIQAEKLPMSPAAAQIVTREPDRLITLLTGGDDYELIFTIKPEDRGNLETLGQELKLKLTEIGHMTKDGDTHVFGMDGCDLVLPRAGWRHD